MSLLVDKKNDVVTVTPYDHQVSAFGVTMAPDKSITHRAFFLAGMAKGVSSIRNPSKGADCNATLEAMKAFGVSVEVESDQVLVLRSSGIAAWHSPEHPIDAQNSGTTARLLMGIAAARQDLIVTLMGDASLSRRPMDRITKPLQSLGADIGGNSQATYLPLRIHGQCLKPFSFETTVPSAQVKSALLFAATSVEGSCEVIVPAGTRDHTERMMAALGAPLVMAPVQGARHKTKFLVTGPWQPPGFSVDIPGDPSALAFFAALAFIHPGLRIHVPRVLGNPGRITYLSLFERMGLQVTLTPSTGTECLGEAVVDVSLVRNGLARPLVLATEDVPALIDEIPALAVALSHCPGVSELNGLGELRIKESDRLGEIERLLVRAGCDVAVTGDRLTIHGGKPIRAYDYDSDDHRMVMAAVILATAADKRCNIGSSEAPAVSFPLFFDMVRRLYA